MLEPWTVLIATHAVAASLALVLGPVQLLRTKGDRAHKIIGRVWVVLMLWVAVGSFLFGGWREPIDIFLRVLAIFTICGTTFGVVLAKRGMINRHRRAMTGGYFGLLAAFGGVVVVPSRRVPSWFVAHPYAMSLVAVAIVAVAGALVGGVLASRPRTRRVVSS